MSADLVRCASCGYEAAPTIWCDFYKCAPDVWPNEDERLCEGCFNREASRAIARLSPVTSSDHYTLEHSNKTLVNVHSPSMCEGRPCTIHNRSDHHMRSWPQHWRADRGIMERICPHGVGHPDPDSPWLNDSSQWVHGCDGCCRKRPAVSSEREWPVTGFRYRCSTGHWVISRRGDLADTACPAKFGNYTVMLGDSVLCGGTLGDPLIDGREASDEIKRLRAALVAIQSEAHTFGDGCDCGSVYVRQLDRVWDVAHKALTEEARREQ